ncbi:unnamed protein product [Symbiodinium pilosum]|uniref:Uncharacterized protein n=1 Tax=Symbiodinium pilosum TaxID=2952 RepID=A0A812X1I5_SYMPI|nr:unnamed protein product [Symbiodinium pilosum]
MSGCAPMPSSVRNQISKVSFRNLVVLVNRELHAESHQNPRKSNGRWLAWGWELGPRGSVEAVSSVAAPQTCRPLPCRLLPRGQRVILVLHLLRDGSRMQLELAALTISSKWHWHFLGAHSFAAPPSDEDSPVKDAAFNFRPAVSTDIGATVRVLASDAFAFTSWLASCSLGVDADA